MKLQAAVTCFRLPHSNDAGIRDFPGEIVGLAPLLVVLFEKDGPTRIRYKGANGRKAHIAGTVVHLDWETQKG